MTFLMDLRTLNNAFVLIFLVVALAAFFVAERVENNLYRSLVHASIVNCP